MPQAVGRFAQGRPATGPWVARGAQVSSEMPRRSIQPLDAGLWRSASPLVAVIGFIVG